jgi:plastocyanin
MKALVKIAAGAFVVLSFSGAAAFAFVQHHVNQTALQFSVARLAVHRGDTVVFSNGDRTSHNITAQGEGMNFNGGLQRPGENVEVTFTARGQHQISCGIHPRMSMTIEVE